MAVKWILRFWSRAIHIVWGKTKQKTRGFPPRPSLARPTGHATYAIQKEKEKQRVQDMIGKKNALTENQERG